MCFVKIQLVSDDAFACSCLQMLAFSERFIATFLFGIFLHLYPASGIRFVIDREECFSHSVPYEGDTVHVSFVVIKADTPWHYSDDGVDLVVRFGLLWALEFQFLMGTIISSKTTFLTILIPFKWQRLCFHYNFALKKQLYWMNHNVQTPSRYLILVQKKFKIRYLEFWIYFGPDIDGL